MKNKEIIKKIIDSISVFFGRWVGVILANGMFIAIGLWLCHSLGYLMTVSFSWRLAVIISIAQHLIRGCFK